MTLSAYLLSKSVFDVQGCRALTLALARLSCTNNQLFCTFTAAIKFVNRSPRSTQPSFPLGQTKNNMDGQHSSMNWTHTGKDSCILKTESSGDSSFMVWPGLGTTIWLKARQGNSNKGHSFLCN